MKYTLRERFSAARADFNLLSNTSFKDDELISMRVMGPVIKVVGLPIAFAFAVAFANPNWSEAKYRKEMAEMDAGIRDAAKQAIDELGRQKAATDQYAYALKPLIRQLDEVLKHRAAPQS